jgi:hypothetical protein
MVVMVSHINMVILNRWSNMTSDSTRSRLNKIANECGDTDQTGGGK